MLCCLIGKDWANGAACAQAIMDLCDACCSLWFFSCFFVQRLETLVFCTLQMLLIINQPRSLCILWPRPGVCFTKKYACTVLTYCTYVLLFKTQGLPNPIDFLTLRTLLGVSADLRTLFYCTRRFFVKVVYDSSQIYVRFGSFLECYVLFRARTRSRKRQ